VGAHRGVCTTRGSDAYEPVVTRACERACARACERACEPAVERACRRTCGRSGPPDGRRAAGGGGGGGAVLAVGLAALLTLGILWGAAEPSSGAGTCERSVDADAIVDAGGDPADAEDALIDALLDAADGVADDGCEDWTVELAGTFLLTDELVWDVAVPLHLVGPAGTTARLQAVGPSGLVGGGPGGVAVDHRILLVDTLPTEVVVTLERLVLAGGDVSLGPVGDDEGGAVLADVLHLIDVELIGNRAVAGGAVSTADLRAVRTSFVGNEAELVVGDGGAVLAFGDVELENVTFVGNVAQRGGALWMDRAGDLSATFVTFHDNEATDGGAGGAGPGGADLHLAEAFGTGTGTITLRGVLFGGTAADSNGPACAGDVTFDAAGGSPIWTGSFERVRSVGGVAEAASCGGPAGSVLEALTFGTVAFLPGTSPLLEPAAGSATIGAVTCGDGWPATDQRGVTRPQGDACDAGAVERVALTTEPEEEEEEESGGEPGGGTPGGGTPGVSGPAAVVGGPVPTSVPAGGGACAAGCPAR
jgi:hypothetical protein